MKFFAPYASQFEAFVDSSLVDTMVPDSLRLAFDGLEPYEALRSLVPLAELRACGVFFTSADIAARLWDPVLTTLSADSIVVDPACGAGDLLLQPAAYLADTNSASKKLTHQIRGTDLEDVFLRTARARLRFKHARGGREEPFDRFEQRDFLADPSCVNDATHVVMNPPFFSTQAQPECTWATGSVNSAAVFVMTAVETMKEGSRLLAILPDVLRSGARYERWRSRVAKFAELARVEPLGQFDAETDVHVFILDLTIRSVDKHDQESERNGWINMPDVTRSRRSVADYFKVRVGPVVPHRDAQTGPEVPFLSTKTIAGNNPMQQRRRFSGRLDAGPLVLVSRTSRPGQSPRARATLWADETPSAVENHLLVLKPIDGTIASCKQLVTLLNDPRTTAFLDARIRCRHLTVGAVREIPWLEMETP